MNKVNAYLTEDFLDCCELFLCSFLDRYGYEYRYLFNRNWCLKDANLFEENMKIHNDYIYIDRANFWEELKNIFGINTIWHFNALGTYLQSNDNLILHLVDAKFLPWMKVYFNRESAEQYIYIDNFDKQLNKFYVIDLKLNFREWVDSEIIYSAYTSMGRRTFEYTNPEYKTNQKNLKNSEKEAYKSITKIKKFLYELKRCEESYLLNIQNILTFRIKQVIEVKLSFVEFLKIINDHKGKNLILQKECLSTVNYWKTLRTYLMKGKIRNQYDLEKINSIADNILESELKVLSLFDCRGFNYVD